MASSVRTYGAAEIIQGFRLLNKQLVGDLKRELRMAGEVVQREAGNLLAPYDPSKRSIVGLKVRVRTTSFGRQGVFVIVEQTLPRTTGNRPDWGVLQMQKGLIPALDPKEPEVMEIAEHAIDALPRRYGF
jgi:hypothetical protein